MRTNRISDPFLLNDICRYITAEANGMYVHEIFSLSKNECVISMRFKDKEFAMEAYMDETTSFVFFPARALSGRTSQALFPELENAKFLSAYANESDRSFFMDFDNHCSVLFKLYGRNANIILFKGGAVHTLFRQQFTKDALLQRSAFEKYSGTNEKQNYFLSRENNELKLSLENDPDTFLQTNNAVDAVNAFAKEYFYIRKFVTQKQKLISTLLKKKQHLEATIAVAKKKTEELIYDSDFKLQADVLMANLHAVPAGALEVELHDFYNDKPILIKLKKDIPPQKHAENLYRKSRKQEIEREKTKEKIDSLQAKLKDVIFDLAAAEKINTGKELKNFIPEDEDKGRQQVIPFRTMKVGDYEILIGKSAQSNDELLRYADKEDVWLHARGVSGSHVIIRKKGKLPVPKEVIARAAQLAAWYSKGKNASLLPVIYTLRKFVRKPKGAAPGAVVCDREEVIMVEPKELSSKE